MVYIPWAVGMKELYLPVLCLPVQEASGRPYEPPPLLVVSPAVGGDSGGSVHVSEQQQGGEEEDDDPATSLWPRPAVVERGGGGSGDDCNHVSVSPLELALASPLPLLSGSPRPWEGLAHEAEAEAEGEAEGEEEGEGEAEGLRRWMVCPCCSQPFAASLDCKDGGDHTCPCPGCGTRLAVPPLTVSAQTHTSPHPHPPYSASHAAWVAGL
jgi:hypothetical protein